MVLINYKQEITMFIVMVVIGVIFNPMNVLAYNLSDIYLSLTLFYSGLLMASNMIWVHEIINFLNNRKFNKLLFLIGIILSIFFILLLRLQIYVDDEQWLKRMISHHSAALTTSNQILKKSDNDKLKKLAKDIIKTQEKEIKIMKSML